MGSQLAVLQPTCRYDGIIGIWYGKSPGLDRASDSIRHAVFAGTSAKGGAVALVPGLRVHARLVGAAWRVVLVATSGALDVSQRATRRKVVAVH